MNYVPVPHHPVLPHHVAPEQVKVVTPCGREEGVGPEEVAKSNWNKSHLDLKNDWFSLKE